MPTVPPSKRRVPRLLPTVAVAMTLVCATRIGMVWRDVEAAFPVSRAWAEPSSSSPAPQADRPAADQPNPAPPSGNEAAAPKQVHFSASEIEVLQELAKRRAELDRRSEELDRRDLLAKAAEQRVDDKLAQLEAYEKKLDAALGQAQGQDDERLNGLVKVYESMKPPEAAAIFEGMEVPAIVPLVTKMKEAKTAAILAAMSPDKARAVTLVMADHKPLPGPRPN